MSISQTHTKQKRSPFKVANYKITHAKRDLKDLVLGRYVNIQKPDTYADPVYKFDTTLTGETAEKLIKAIDGALESGAVETGSKPSNKRPYKRQDDNSVVFTFKIKEFEKDVRPFKLWDMNMKPIEDVPNLTGGTVVNVNFAFYVSNYKGTAFVALQPTHIQVKHAEVYTGNEGAEPTFGEGDGYASEEGSPQFDNQEPQGRVTDDDF